MEETTSQGGGGAKEVKGKAGQEEGDQSRTGEEVGSTEEGRRRKIEEGRSREESKGNQKA